MPTFNSDPVFLTQAIDSVLSQSYANWELCISDDCSEDSTTQAILSRYERNDKIKIKFRNKNGHISVASNTALSMATGEFIAFLDHDDLLHPHALAAVASAINDDPSVDIIYSDEDKIDENSNRFAPHFKSDWNPDLLFSQNYICHLTVFRAPLIKRLRGLRAGFEGAQDHDLLLRATELTSKICHIPHVLYHWRAKSGSTALDTKEKDYTNAAAEKAIAEAFERRDIKANASMTDFGVYHKISYELPQEKPRVTAIIPTKDYSSSLGVVIDGLLNKTDYPNLEIIVINNDSQEPETFDFFQKAKRQGVKIIDFPGEFNYSAINNFAVKNATGDILLLLNNDVEVINNQWLKELVSHSIRHGIGAVGPRLYYPDDHVQHDGIVIGIGGVAGYANPRLHRNEVGEHGGSRLSRNYSAVTGAVLAVRKEIYEKVGGLDEKNLAVAFNDVDFCLKLTELGYRNLFTPFAELYHHESLSRGDDTSPKKSRRFQKEALYMKSRWSKQIENDPYYNPNLSLRKPYSIDESRAQPWPWQS
jgi:glycosyltransferase involved in cell wall biosynthesis